MPNAMPVKANRKDRSIKLRIFRHVSVLNFMIGIPLD
jgi:hypothetical protein